MHTKEISPLLATLFAELVDGTNKPGNAFVLNSGDIGLLRSIDKLAARDASRSVNDGATIAAHTKHVCYGLSLMNQWAREGGDPFANARWDEAWKTKTVDEAQWTEIRTSLRDNCRRWLEVLRTPRDVSAIELTGMIASAAHVAYHLGAIRQIDRSARGPKEGTFAQ